MSSSLSNSNKLCRLKSFSFSSWIKPDSKPPFSFLWLFSKHSLDLNLPVIAQWGQILCCIFRRYFDGSKHTNTNIKLDLSLKSLNILCSPQWAQSSALVCSIWVLCITVKCTDIVCCTYRNNLPRPQNWNGLSTWESRHSKMWISTILTVLQSHHTELYVRLLIRKLLISLQKQPQDIRHCD